MILGLDHILIAVADVEHALETYRRLGFDAQRGGEHPGMGTYNGLVPLADGCYLELIGVRDRSLAEAFPHTRRVVQALDSTNHIATYAFDSTDLDADVRAARERGLDMQDPIEGERLRPDGTRVAWKTAHPVDHALPFLLQDLTSRETRISAPTGGLGLHLRVRELVHGSADPGAWARALGQLTGTFPTESRIRLGRGSVRLVPAEQEGPLELALACDDSSAVAGDWQERRVGFASTAEAGILSLRPQETKGVALVLESGGLHG